MITIALVQWKGACVATGVLGALTAGGSGMETNSMPDVGPASYTPSAELSDQIQSANPPSVTRFKERMRSPQSRPRHPAAAPLQRNKLSRAFVR